MPVIVFIGNARRFMDDFCAYFKDKFEVVVQEGEFKTIWSQLATQDEKKLYLLPGLTKPERYEIFCHSRKNRQQFLSIVDEDNDESSPSDRNKMQLKSFDGKMLCEKLEASKVASTSANRRSKGVSVKGIAELKKVINETNNEYLGIEKASLVLKECEDRMTKIWRINMQASVEEIIECYRSLIETEMKKKQTWKSTNQMM
ncbi:hypothetical protein GINT2_001975 [Glugoides intestinalis]